MDSVVFTIILLLFFISLRWKSVKSYLIGVMKICYDSSAKSCSCSGAKMSVASSADRVGCNVECEKPNVDDREDRVLENIGYFVASNDEKKAAKYCPTSLQDIDPNGLA